MALKKNWNWLWMSNVVPEYHGFSFYWFFEVLCKTIQWKQKILQHQALGRGVLLQSLRNVGAASLVSVVLHSANQDTGCSLTLTENMVTYSERSVFEESCVGRSSKETIQYSFLLVFVLLQ